MAPSTSTTTQPSTTAEPQTTTSTTQPAPSETTTPETVPAPPPAPPPGPTTYLAVDLGNNVVVLNVADGSLVRSLGQADVSAALMHLSPTHDTVYVMGRAIDIATGTSAEAFPGTGAGSDLASDLTGTLVGWTVNGMSCDASHCTGNELQIRDLAGGRTRTLGPVGQEFENRPAFSADGNLLALSETQMSSRALIRVLDPFGARDRTDGKALSIAGCDVLPAQFRGATHHVVAVSSCVNGPVELVEFDADSGAIVSQLRLLDPPGGAALVSYDRSGEFLLVGRYMQSSLGGFQILPPATVRNGQLVEVPLSVPLSGAWVAW
jgi:hypothetical protein